MEESHTSLDTTNNLRYENDERRTFKGVFVPVDDAPLSEVTLPRENHIESIKELLGAENLLWCWPRHSRKKQKGGALIMDKDWRTKGLSANPRATLLYENEDKKQGGYINLYGPAVFADPYFIDEDEVTGEPLPRGVWVFNDLTINSFTAFYDVAKRRKEARERGDYSLMNEILAESQLSRLGFVTSSSSSLPNSYDDNWGDRKTPLALLTEYKQKCRWKYPFAWSHTGPNEGPFVATLSIPDLQLKFTPRQPSKQLKIARQQAALVALHYIHNPSNTIDGTVDKISYTFDDAHDKGGAKEQREPIVVDESKWVSITEDGKVRKQTLRGGTGDSLQQASNVTIHYVGRMIIDSEQEVFDETEPNQPRTFTLGDGSVIYGLDIGVSTMQIHEKALFSISYEYGYGLLGAYPLVPPKTHLLFEVELLDGVQKVTEDVDGMALAEAERQDGNSFYKNENYKKALFCYNRGINRIQEKPEDETPDHAAARIELLNALCLNAANASLKLGYIRRAEDRCEQVLSRTPGATKALYWKAKAMMEDQRFEDAAKTFKHLLGVMAIPAEKKNILQQLQELQVKQEMHKRKMQEMCKKMF